MMVPSGVPSGYLSCTLAPRSGNPQRTNYREVEELIPVGFAYACSSGMRRAVKTSDTPE